MDQKALQVLFLAGSMTNESLMAFNRPSSTAISMQLPRLALHMLLLCVAFNYCLASPICPCVLLQGPVTFTLAATFPYYSIVVPTLTYDHTNMLDVVADGLMGTISFIWAAAVLHVLSQAECCKFLMNAHSLLAQGGSVYGWTIGAKQAGEVGRTPDGKQKRWAHSMVSKWSCMWLVSGSLTRQHM